MGAKSGMKNSGSIPPGARQQTADKIREHIPPVAGHVFENVRSPPLEEDGPKNQVQGNLAESGRGIVAAKSQPAMQQQQRWQRAGNKQPVIKPGVKKGLVKMRLEQKPIQPVETASKQEEGITQITETVHNNAKITRPAAPARQSLTQTIIIPIA